MRKPALQPEVKQLSDFLASLRKESDRGAALVAASMLDERLHEILEAFLAEVPCSRDLLVGFNAPLGTLSARAMSAYSLGLIQRNEFEEISLMRKIRNEFGHGWEPLSFESESIAALAQQLPWLGPSDQESGSTLRSRFSFAIAILLTDLMWRVELVRKERRTSRVWEHKARRARAA